MDTTDATILWHNGARIVTHSLDTGSGIIWETIVQLRNGMGPHGEFFTPYALSKEEAIEIAKTMIGDNVKPTF